MNVQLAVPVGHTVIQAIMPLTNCWVINANLIDTENTLPFGIVRVKALHTMINATLLVLSKKKLLLIKIMSKQCSLETSVGKKFKLALFCSS